MRSSVLLCLVLSSFSLFAQVDQRLGGRLAYYGDDFYNRRQTKDSLYIILNEQHSYQKGRPDQIGGHCSHNCYRHVSVGYDTARKILFGELFVQRDHRGPYVVDVYCGKKFHFNNVNDVSRMHTQVNIEHTWPQSKFSSHFDKRVQKSDMHHLYPADSLANNRRANNSFGDLENNVDELNVHDCDNSKLGDIRGHFIFTPPPSHKGNVARSLFYFATRYRLFIGPAEEIILRQWHKSDPVDEGEKNRHEIIAKYQKVRNPFVDYPELVERISDF